MKKSFFTILVFIPFIFSFRHTTTSFQKIAGDSVRYAREKHFKNIHQLTFGADNAEAYWSFDGKFISFQSNNKDWGPGCDQIFYMPIDGTDLSSGQKPSLISTGMGRTTCSFFMPDGKSILYASTHLGGKECPKDVERKPGGKDLWPEYESYAIFVADLRGSITTQLTQSHGNNAEATT